MKPIHPFLFSFLILYISGCSKLIEDDFPPFARQPVVNSIIKSGEPVVVNLSFTSSIDTSSFQYINNAEVQLYTDGVFTEQLAEADLGNYQFQTVAQPGSNYQCRVQIPGFNTLVASQYIPTKPPFYNLFHTDEAVKNEEGISYPSITFSISNDPLQTKYYEVLIHMIVDDQTTFLEPPTRPGWITHITDPILLQEGLEMALFSTENIADTSYTMSINYFTLQQTRSGNGPWKTRLFPIIVEFRSVSFDYYQFAKQYYLYENGRRPDIMGGPVTAFPLHSNIEGGYGIFAGYTAVASEILYPADSAQ